MELGTAVWTRNGRSPKGKAHEKADHSIHNNVNIANGGLCDGK